MFQIIVKLQIILLTIFPIKLRQSQHFVQKMKKVLDTTEIRSKIHLLMGIDEQTKQKLQRQKSNNYKENQIILTQIKPKAQHFNQEALLRQQKQQMENRFKQVIYTKGDIVKEISKLKPYLNPDKEELTTVELENMENKKVTAEEKKSLSNVIIYLNKRLCEKLRQQGILDQYLNSDRQRLQKKGWIYEVFYRRSENPKAELSKNQFHSGYAIMTTILQIYSDLTFGHKVAKLNVSQIKRVKYTEQREYQIIDIRYDGGTLQVGFVNDAKFQLFDKMLFLLKNMARTSTNRLFQNQLIKSLYAEY